MGMAGLLPVEFITQAGDVREGGTIRSKGGTGETVMPDQPGSGSFINSRSTLVA